MFKTSRPGISANMTFKPEFTQTVGSDIGKKLVICKDTRYDFPSVGDSDVIYKANKEGILYQWNSEKVKYEKLLSSNIDGIRVINGGNANGNGKS